METRLLRQLFFPVLLLFFLFQSCGGQGDSSTDGTVGTVIDRPGTPASVTIEIFPDFPGNLTQESLLSVTLEGLGEPFDPSSRSGSTALEMFANLWNNTILRGDTLTLIAQFEYLKECEEKINHGGFDDSNSDTQVISVDECFFFGLSSAWEVTITPDDSAWRLYFKNPNGLIQASYYRRTDEDRGILAFVNTDFFTSSEPPTLGPPLFLELAFDFTDPTQNLMALRTVNWRVDRYESLLFLQQCGEETTECISQHGADKKLMNFRFSYVDESRQVCFGALNAQGAVVKTYSFTGPELAEGVEPSMNTCQISQPVSVLSTEHLALAATANAVFGDGSSLTGWDQELTDEQIDSLTHP